MRPLPAAVCACALLAAMHASGQVAAPATPQATAPAAAPAWSLYASALAYFPPESEDYVSPVVTADRGTLHLEARYNYEALHTGSVWGGYNFTTGEDVVFEATAMAGAVFGDTAGIAPGYRLALTYSSFGLSSEGEYLFDTRNRGDSFFYSWTELTWSPADWFRTGLVGQRTRAYKTELDIQRGVLAGFTAGNWSLTVYLLNPDRDDRMLVVGLGAEF